MMKSMHPSNRQIQAQPPFQPYNNMTPRINYDPRFSRGQYANLPLNKPPSINPNIVPTQYRSQSQTNLPLPGNTGQSINRGSGVPIQSFNNRHGAPIIGQNLYQSIPRQNNFMREPEYFPSTYVSPMGRSSYAGQAQYRPPQIIAQGPQYYPQQYSQMQPPIQYYPQQQFGSSHYSIGALQQSYFPLYKYPSYQGTGINQPRNIPQQSINSNFNYENANFDCNYTIEENLVHCVLCNQTYKTTQKKQHLELHRQKVKNVNIRPVDEDQIKRLEKYNSMNRKGLLIKPIVEPDQFNVQYNPNEFVLKKVTKYKDPNQVERNTIKIQTDSDNDFLLKPRVLGYQESNQPRRGQSSRLQYSRPQSSSPPGQQNLGRNTNTRFSSEAGREQEQIFLTQRFDKDHKEKSEFEGKYNAQNSLRESDRSSFRVQEMGYEQESSRYKKGQSMNKSMSFQKGSSLHDINQADQQLRQSNSKQIPIEKIINNSKRESQY